MLTDPQIPASLAGSIVALFGLNNLSPSPAPTPRPAAELRVISPLAAVPGNKHFSPQDFWLFYNEAPPTNPGANGGTTAPDCIALLEIAILPALPSPSSSPTPSVLDIFTSQFNIPAVQIQIIPTDPNTPPSQPLGSRTIFTFNPLLSIPAGGVAQFTLDARLSRNAAQADTAGRYAGLLPGGGSHSKLPMGASLGLLVIGLLVIPTGRRRRAIVIAALITMLAFSQIGCGGDSSGVVNSSQQQVPAGGVATTNAYGTVSVQGLPATMSTIRLVS
jgi:hypothetical protein